MVNHKYLPLLSVFIGVSGCFSVLFGAWLAHAGAHLAPDIHNRLTTALNYQLIHTLALLAVAVWAQNNPSSVLLRSALCFCLGILLFSVSLYLKTWLAMPFIGKAAPFGGVLLAFAWLNLAFVGKNK